MTITPPESTPKSPSAPTFRLIRIVAWIGNGFFPKLLAVLVATLAANVVQTYLATGTFAFSNFLQLPVVAFVRMYPILSAAIGIATVTLAAVGLYFQRVTQTAEERIHQESLQRVAQAAALEQILQVSVLPDFQVSYRRREVSGAGFGGELFGEETLEIREKAEAGSYRASHLASPQVDYHFLGHRRRTYQVLGHRQMIAIALLASKPKSRGF